MSYYRSLSKRHEYPSLLFSPERDNVNLLHSRCLWGQRAEQCGSLSVHRSGSCQTFCSSSRCWIDSTGYSSWAWPTWNSYSSRCYWDSGRTGTCDWQNCWYSVIGGCRCYSPSRFHFRWRLVCYSGVSLTLSCLWLCCKTFLLHPQMQSWSLHCSPLGRYTKNLDLLSIKADSLVWGRFKKNENFSFSIKFLPPVLPKYLSRVSVFSHSPQKQIIWLKKHNLSTLFGTENGRLWKKRYSKKSFFILNDQRKISTNLTNFY